VAVTDTEATIPLELANVFAAASRAERTARESQRRTAFRNTRHLIAGAHANGILLSDIAAVLGVSTSTIRSRNGGDGAVSASDFARLAGLSLDTLTRWHNQGLLSHVTAAQDGRTSYLASELIRALMA
jgi:hypothetical protein